MVEKQRILIVDDEAPVLAILKNSLKKLGDDYEIHTADNALFALQQLEQHSFNVVITDYQMANMNGLQLLEAIQAVQPETKVIMITAYGTDEIEAEARRLQAYEYLTKPLEISTFRQIVKDALEDMAISRPGFLILSDTRYREALTTLEQLKVDVGARYIFLADAGGHIIARAGDEGKLAVDEIAPLLGGGISTVIEVGRTLDGNVDAVTLIYREGDSESLYIVNVGQQMLLVLVIDQSTYSSRLGSAWYYAKQTAVSLRKILGDIDFSRPPEDFLDDDVQQAFDDELDKLFMD